MASCSQTWNRALDENRRSRNVTDLDLTVAVEKPPKEGERAGYRPTLVRNREIGRAALWRPAKRRRAVQFVRNSLGQEQVSERRACQVLSQSFDTAAPTARAGTMNSTNQHRGAGHAVRAVRLPPGHESASSRGMASESQAGRRLWRQEGLRAPLKRPKRRRLWLNHGSCVRLRPQFRDHVELLLCAATNTRWASELARKLSNEDVLERLSHRLIRRSVPRITFVRATDRRSSPNV
jgi:hypothetical protein